MSDLPLRRVLPGLWAWIFDRHHEHRELYRQGSYGFLMSKNHGLGPSVDIACHRMLCIDIDLSRLDRSQQNTGTTQDGTNNRKQTAKAGDCGVGHEPVPGLPIIVHRLSLDESILGVDLGADD